MTVARLLVAAPSRGAGKSTVAVGLAAALKARGRVVQTFKKGPDFIDPMWLSAASGRTCRNLDFFMMGPERIAASFPARAAGADFALVEANHGLHDGPDPAGSDSGAALARLLGLPVVLVVNAQRLNRGVAPLVKGQIDFDPHVRFAGVVLNRVRGARHEGKLRDAIGRYCGLEVLGALPDLAQLGIAERHLGLTPLAEDPDLEPIVGRLGAAVAKHLDLDRIEAVAGSAIPLKDDRDAGGSTTAGRGCEAGDHGGSEDPEPTTVPGALERVRIGVAMDRAFTFYYPENLEALAAAGADLVPFSPLDDPRLPPVAGLYFGGGFPEFFMERLEANAGMRAAVRAAIAGNVPTWAECGGLMYLSQGIAWRGRKAAMAGALPCSVGMDERPAGHGYVLLEETGAGAWPSAGRRLRGHEFHHSHLAGLDAQARFAYRTLRGGGAAPGFDGLVVGSCTAGYTHLHADGAPFWAGDFVRFARERGRST